MFKEEAYFIYYKKKKEEEKKRKKKKKKKKKEKRKKKTEEIKTAFLFLNDIKSFGNKTFYFCYVHFILYKYSKKKIIS